MAKSTGLGQALYVAGRDLSGDIGSLSRIGGGPQLLEITGIDKSALERIGGIRDGELSFACWYDVPLAHAFLKTLPTADEHLLWQDTAAIGGASAGLVAKQINYDWARGADASLAGTVQGLGQGFGLEFTEMLTAGKRTDTAATNGASLDFGSVSSLFGMSAYLQVFAFTGTSITVTLEDSADNAIFAPITAGAFTAVTAAPTTERIQTATGATIRRFVRVATSGTFTNCQFAVAFIRHLTSTL